jgi:hypothetical protein
MHTPKLFEILEEANKFVLNLRFEFQNRNIKCWNTLCNKSKERLIKSLKDLIVSNTKINIKLNFYNIKVDVIQITIVNHSILIFS